ncbi:MAG TPA: FAD-dependent oxidoreductase [Candidatus Paceibacterota bacterium]|jgi:ferredoxin-NADP reductase|nr:FAD-dependent oxidoreductase [Candidatus Paceibacterota bacterium]
MIAWIDRQLNKITMYRLTLYVLIGLVALGVVFSAVHLLPYDPIAMVLSTLVLLVACVAINDLCAWIFRAQPNVESAYITALILALIITPVAFAPFSVSNFLFLIWAPLFAMASKYVLAINKKHVFNPAAIAVAATGLILNAYASWWVGGNLPLLAFVLVGGLLIVRKIRRFDLVLPFFAGALVSIYATQSLADPFGTLGKIVLHTPIFFFAFVMLAEPATTPPTRALRIAYGALVGLLYAPAIHLGPIYSIPELALCVGNIFSFAVSPQGKQSLVLKEKKEMGTNLYDFAFVPAAGATAGPWMRFRPGQYMEWTLTPDRSAAAARAVKNDARGNRRYFTIASSPTERELHLGVKFYEPSSSFKKQLLAMEPGARIMGGELTGDFTLPNDPAKKLVFIAGGIGITPFRSMVKYLSDRGEKRDVVLFYSNHTTAEISYREVFDEAARTVGLKTIYAVTGPGEKLPQGGYQGRIDEALIAKTVEDYRERTFYISGTHAMVSAMEAALHGIGIPRAQIKTDFFPGFA